MTNSAPWWQSVTAYQIYPRSFCDSNGDGIGDLPGIISRLDYLRDLGVGMIWLSPVYRSPMIDNGYDIADYRDIAPEFGTLADMDRLIAEARARGIGIVMDLVVNHSSSEHDWFKAALADPTCAERDYYIWRDAAPGGGPPDDRQSFFGGPAWTRDPASGQYYCNLFTPDQPDPNWRNPALRAEIYAMMNWWFDRGIAGFRMDVIDLIGKDVDTGEIDEGPYLHGYLQEMHRETLAGRDVVTIGESWNASLDTALLYSGRDRAELSMIFQFGHIIAGWDPEHGKWSAQPVDLVALKRSFSEWQTALATDGWNSLFWCNHDLPRAVSKYGDDGDHRVASAKMLATFLHLMKGTPFIYQGEEIGMTNAAFTDLSQFRDIETLNFHAIQTAKGVSTADFLRGANTNGRDNARTPVQWTAEPGAGFTTGTPWIDINPNHKEINVAAALADPDSILAHYRALVKLRRELTIIQHGSFCDAAPDHPKVFAYQRRLGAQRLSVLGNFTGAPVCFDVPDVLRLSGECLIATHGDRTSISGRVDLAPYEAFAVCAG